jgi:hypothetical protein
MQEMDILKTYKTDQQQKGENITWCFFWNHMNYGMNTKKSNSIIDHIY